MQNSVCWTSVRVSMGARPHLSFCACKKAWFAPEYQVYMGSGPHLLFCACKTATFGPKLHVSMGPRTLLWISACKTACLTSELLVSMGPSPHLWFFHAKQRHLVPNSKSLWVPDSTCRFVHQSSVISPRTTCLYGSQPFSVVLCMQNGVISTRIASVYGSLSRAESLKKV